MITLELLAITLSAVFRVLTLEEVEISFSESFSKLCRLTVFGNEEAFEITEDFEWVFEGS